MRQDVQKGEKYGIADWGFKGQEQGCFLAQYTAFPGALAPWKHLYCEDIYAIWGINISVRYQDR